MPVEDEELLALMASKPARHAGKRRRSAHRGGGALSSDEDDEDHGRGHAHRRRHDAAADVDPALAQELAEVDRWGPDGWGDAAERARLEALPEIEREAILGERAELRQQVVERMEMMAKINRAKREQQEQLLHQQQLQQHGKPKRSRGADAGSDSDDFGGSDRDDDDNDDDDDDALERRRSARRDPGVTTKTSRKEKLDKLRRRKERKERGRESLSASSSGDDDHDDDGGAYGAGDDDLDDDADRAAADRRRRARASKRHHVDYSDDEDDRALAGRAQGLEDDDDLDDGRGGRVLGGRSGAGHGPSGEPATYEMIRPMQVTRSELEKWCHWSNFRATVVGALARLGIGVDPETKQNVYRVVQILSVQPYHRSYRLGRTQTDLALLLGHGKAEKQFLMDLLSDGPITDLEWSRYDATVKAEGLPPVTQAACAAKVRALKAMRAHVLTDDEITQILQRKQALTGITTYNPAAELSAKRNELVALQQQRSPDPAAIAALQADVDALQSRIRAQTQALNDGPRSQLAALAELNARNRRSNLTEGREAERRAAAERKAKGAGTYDPFARVRTLPRHVITQEDVAVMEEQAALTASATPAGSASRRASTDGPLGLAPVEDLNARALDKVKNNFGLLDRHARWWTSVHRQGKKGKPPVEERRAALLARSYTASDGEDELIGAVDLSSVRAAVAAAADAAATIAV
ncbi:hypothetical protein CXG81DRAFT_23477 [Caulochytrium protostelioides]|uniref:Plus3 domain-containing protein n=1 Tax=Caulochytrium protostelioides TaxID=1555241 RepID=A0A4P9XFI6_9FUNG|nr:hypothetical protein CXG81DRAFT_23477 [Caulochytrium protostelioides]|eukprot:RKP03920.1 hypothetical protein CXG81DRAFT_23477 [Caulochytrium protostelioides]